MAVIRTLGERASTDMVELVRALGTASSLSLRRRILLAVAVATLAGAVTWAHSGPALDHMGMGEAVAVCLAVAPFAALALSASPASTPRAPREPAPLPIESQTVAVRIVCARSHASPAQLQVLRT